MAYSVLSYRILKNDQSLVGSTIQREQVVRITCVCDTVADLPPIDLVTVPEGTMRLAPGSRAHIIATSADYMLDSAGNWIQQLPPSAAATYTKQEIDAMIQDIDDNLADLQQDLADLRTDIATDRSVLADLIDNGSKNIANMTLSSFTTTTKDGVTVSLSDDTITTSGNSGTSGNSFYNVFYNGNSALLPDGDWVASLYGTGIENFRIEVYDNVTGDVVKGQFGVPFHFSIPTGVNQSFLRITQKPSATCTGSFRLMICLKAAWDISTKFVPYCPTLEDLYKMVKSYHP